jgi:hypothetical protein
VLILYATYELCELWHKGRGSQIFEADEFNKNFIPPPIKEKPPKLSQVSDVRIKMARKSDITFDQKKAINKLLVNYPIQ